MIGIEQTAKSVSASGPPRPRTDSRPPGIPASAAKSKGESLSLYLDTSLKKNLDFFNYCMWNIHFDHLEIDLFN